MGLPMMNAVRSHEVLTCVGGIVVSRRTEPTEATRALVLVLVVAGAEAPKPAERHGKAENEKRLWRSLHTR